MDADRVSMGQECEEDGRNASQGLPWGQLPFRLPSGRIVEKFVPVV